MNDLLYFTYFVVIGNICGGIFFGGPNGIVICGMIGLFVAWINYEKQDHMMFPVLNN